MEQLERLLRDQVRASEERRVSIDAQVQRLVADRERERQVVERANALLLALGVEPEPGSEPEPEPEPEPERAQPALPASPIGTQPRRPAGIDFTAGNRSDKTPKRRSEFASVSLLDAARRLLGSGEAMRLDDLASAIFDTQDPDQLRAAKGSLRSAMANGVERGYWAREGPGAFRGMGQEAGGTTM